MQAYILSGLDISILKNEGIAMIFWPEEISQQLMKLGASIYIEH